MDLIGLLKSCQKAVRQYRYLSNMASKLPIVLVLCLCSCMLWQCSTCLDKYFASPTGASMVFRRDLSQSPIAITICNKGPELNWTFPELASVDVRQGPRIEWQTIWPPARTDSFVTVTHKSNQRLCQTIPVYESSPFEFRLRHNYSDFCKVNKLEVYLHNKGLFQSSGFSIIIPKTIFSSAENFILELILETMISLPSAEFNCSQEEELAETLDSCLLAEAMKAANQSAGCLAKQLRLRSSLYKYIKMYQVF